MANPLAEHFARFSAGESWSISDAGGTRFFTTEEPNRPSALSTTGGLSSYRVQFDWTHVHLSGDLYRLESDESGAWATIMDDIAAKSVTRTWTDRAQANFRVRTKRGGVLSDPSPSASGKTNTRVAGTFKDTTRTPQSGVDIFVIRADTNTIIATGQTNASGAFDIELDANWPYTVSVVAEGVSPSINGSIASHVQA